MNRTLSEITFEELERLAVLKERVLQNVAQNATVGRPLAHDGTKRSIKPKYNRTENEIAADFWINVNIGDVKDCWNWMRSKAGKIGNQYGVFGANGKKYAAHQFAASFLLGEKPKGMLACHKCDNTICCNPTHIYYGTHKDNDTDMRTRGRAFVERGSSRYNAKLTEEQVAIIKAEAPFRKRGWGKAMAERFGVGRTAISNIVSGGRWRSV